MKVRQPMIAHLVDTRTGMRNLLVAVAVVAWSASAAAQFDEPPPDGFDLICIDADPPVDVPDSAQLAARLAGYDAPAGLSIKQSERLSQVAEAFRSERELLALQHWGAAVTDAAQTVGARNLDLQDIADLESAVLKQVVAEQAHDLRLLIAQLEHVNAQKAELRDYANTLRDQQADLLQCSDNCDSAIQAEVDSELARSIDALDALGDITQEKQARLAYYLDAYTKMMEMVSNAIAKMSDTAEKIIENLK